MKLPEVLAALGQEMPTHAGWTVAILTRKAEDGSIGESVVEYPIFDISIDHEDGEINLLTDERSKAPRPASEALNLEQLLNRLKSLEDKCGNYSVFSGSAFIPLDEEYEGRIDVPLVGVARNHDARIYGFLQWPPEQWETPA